MLRPLGKWNDILLSSVTDIACTKLVTISARGSKKDFIDLYMVLQKTTLPELFINLEEKYKNVNYNYPHILKSLVYFDDADIQPMPKMHIPLEWNSVLKDISCSHKGISNRKSGMSALDPNTHF